MGIPIGYTHDVSGATIYALLMDSSGLYYHVANAGFETWTGDTDDHDVQLAEGDGNWYFATVADNPVPGEYAVKVYEQLGGSPDIDADLLLTTAPFSYAQEIGQEVTNYTLYAVIASGSGGSGGGTDLSTIEEKIDDLTEDVLNIASKVRSN